MTENILTDLNNIASILEDAVNEQDWTLVVDAYGLLTGRELDDPKTPDNPGDILAELMARLSRLEGGKETKPPKKTTSKERTVSTNPVGKAKSKGATGRTNKFEEMVDIHEEVGKDPTFKKAPTKKSLVKKREPCKPAKVTCVKCHKTLEVSPTLARENFQCDNCIGS